jgi:lysyl-tRNA synthetase, class II
MTSRLDRITEQRLEKIERMRSRGVDPYPPRFTVTHSAAQAAELLKAIEGGAAQPDQVTVAGRIMAQRGMGKISFLDVRDGTGKIQLLIKPDQLDEAGKELVKDLDIGDFVGAAGKVFRTRTGEPTVSVDKLTMLSKSLQPLPEKWHGLSDTEKRYRQRYLDLISNPAVKDTFIARSKIIAAVRCFLDQRGFLEVETPVLQPEAGGATARPFVTHHNALDRDLFLRIALELHLKRLIVGGIDKVYEIGRVFRNEGIDTMHNPEFTMLESYEAYADYNSVMRMVEEMVHSVAMQVQGRDTVEFGACSINLKPPWQRIELRQAILDGSGIDFVQYPEAEMLRNKMREMGMEADPKKNWAKLVDELLTNHVQPKLVQPTFLIDYPESMTPLAKNKPGMERVVERFEGYIGGMEVSNAFSELNDPVEQRKRFTEQMKEKAAGDEEAQGIDEDFVTALEHGMPPTGGLGVGIDRLVMLLTNQTSIREVIFFPQMKERE